MDEERQERNLAYHQIITSQGDKTRQILIAGVKADVGEHRQGWSFPREERKRVPKSGVAMSAMDALCQIPGNSREGIEGVMDWMNHG